MLKCTITKTYLIIFFCLVLLQIINRIDDEAFCLLDADTMKDLIPAVGPRIKFLKAFKAFCQIDQPVADIEAERERPHGHISREGQHETEEDEVRTGSGSI